MPNSSTDKPTKNVAVIGIGLVGCLAALGVANKFGWSVDIYDARSTTDKAADDKKAINLALSARGLRAFEEIDPHLATEMVRIGVRLNGRMVHDYKGNTNFEAYGPHNEAILSINRLTMIHLLKDAMEACPLIEMHFSHKLAKTQGTTMEFENPMTGERIHATADLIIGADGAYSALREQMRRVIKMDTSTRWAPLSYLKIKVVPKTLPNGEKADAFDPSVLHIWPRKDFVLIAPSNPDKTFTCVLLAPDALLERLHDDGKFTRKFFPETFPSFMRGISIEEVLTQVETNPIVPMCAIKCSPLNDEHHILIGDAAHVVVPYLGHGANIGYEDVRLLLGCLARNPDQKAALDFYSKTRQADLDAIDRVSWAHIHEISEHVLQVRYLARKWLDFTLARAFPGRWVPLYVAIVSDTETSYANVVKRDRRQARIVRSAKILLIALLLWIAWKLENALMPWNDINQWVERSASAASHRVIPS